MKTKHTLAILKKWKYLSRSGYGWFFHTSIKRYESREKELVHNLKLVGLDKSKTYKRCGECWEEIQGQATTTEKV